MELPINKIMNGDCLKHLKELPENSVDAIITDPPYGLSFMNKHWDYDVPSVEIWKECLRVLKHGGHLLSFAGTRTYHRMTINIEDAGFEIRDCIEWVYGSGFPKSLNIANMLAKREGAKREGAGTQGNTFPIKNEYREYVLTDTAKQWKGWGTALKPAHEPIVLARKPLSEKTVAENVLKWGTGGINIDGCRVKLQTDEIKRGGFGNAISGYQNKQFGDNGNEKYKCEWKEDTLGRFPANLIHDGSEEVLKEFEKAGISSPGGYPKYQKAFGGIIYGKYKGIERDTRINTDSGSASRFFKTCEYTEEDYDYPPFFYTAKASKSERNEGPSSTNFSDRGFGEKDGHKHLPTITKNNHPTVKPLKLMEYLIKLVTKENQIVLDPFLGSGTTALACIKLNRLWIGIERESEYIKIAEARINHFANQTKLCVVENRKVTE